jgi:hypothetical protein
MRTAVLPSGSNAAHRGRGYTRSELPMHHKRLMIDG